MVNAGQVFNGKDSILSKRTNAAELVRTIDGISGARAVYACQETYMLGRDAR